MAKSDTPQRLDNFYTGAGSIFAAQYPGFNYHYIGLQAYNTYKGNISQML